jgi:hypothetical protein
MLSVVILSVIVLNIAEPVKSVEPAADGLVFPPARCHRWKPGRTFDKTFFSSSIRYSV